MIKRRPYPIVLVGLFIASLCIPLPVSFLLTFYDNSHYREKRQVAPPNIRNTPIRQFLGDFKYYFEENFFLKHQLLSLNAQLRTTVFSDKKYPNVEQGQAGFYFLSGSEITDFTQKRIPFTPEDLNAWALYLSTIDRKLAAMGVDFQVVLAPNKHDIYPEYAPAWLQYQTHHTHRRQAFITLTDKHLRNKAIDLSSALRNEKQELIANKTQVSAPLFFHTDTHWNEYGAAVASEVLLKALNIDIDNFEKERQQQPTGGDLARMSGQKDKLSEHYIRVNYPQASICHKDNGKPLIRNELDAIIPDVIDCRSNNPSNRRAIIFTDSFGVSMAPSLSQGFTESRFIFQYEFDFEIVETLKPDNVIYLLVARKLQSLAPDQLFQASFSKPIQQ